MNNSDDGEINFGITSVEDRVIMNFETPVKWIGFTKEQARQVASSLESKAGYSSTNSLRALHLVAEGEYVILRMEVKGVWVDLIKERLDSAFSHIIEPAGIITTIKKFL